MKLIKPSDIKTIERFHEHDYLALALKSIKEWKDIDIGEVLVQRDLSNKKLVQVSGTCKVPRKYKVVYKCELGIPWVKQISVRGGLGVKLYPLTHFLPHRYIFEIDPEKIDSMLLGNKYDPRIEYKRMRDSDPEYGKE
jgi:hypothetical protein